MPLEWDGSAPEACRSSPGINFAEIEREMIGSDELWVFEVETISRQATTLHRINAPDLTADHVNAMRRSTGWSMTT
jgi:hypothetical protein